MLNKQLLIRISPELEELITRAYSQYLGQTKEHITRTDFIRRGIQAQCELALSKK